MDDHQCSPDDCISTGELARVCAQVDWTCLYLARFGSWSTCWNALTKWNTAHKDMPLFRCSGKTETMNVSKSMSGWTRCQRSGIPVVLARLIGWTRCQKSWRKAVSMIDMLSEVQVLRSTGERERVDA